MQSRLIAWLQTQPGRAGQLQKAITYGEKALEMAEKSKNPGSLFRAIDTLILHIDKLEILTRPES